MTEATPPAWVLADGTGDLSLAKRHVDGTHRLATPEETLARFAPLGPRMGITRVGVLTGLDTLGIPVCFAARPNSRSIAVFQGKGLTLAAAKVSAFMEAAETFHAEDIRVPCRLARAADLEAAGLAAIWEGLPLAKAAAFDPDSPIPWIEARHAVSGAPVWVPLELASTDYTEAAAARLGRIFEANTNGLASGNHRVEAFAHALYELVERDAVALWQLREGPGEPAIDLDTVTDPGCRWLVERLAAAGTRIRLWDATSDIGVPTYVCLLADAQDGATDPELGAGCHPDPAIAMARALSEAAQARTTWIAGARDDFAPSLYGPAARRSRRAASLRWLDVPATAPATARAGCAGASLADDLAATLSALAGVGLRDVYMVDLTRPDLGLPVVRAIVPGLEAPVTGPVAEHRPGRRGARILAAGRAGERGAAARRLRA
jgi:ribosomal protein S12 methylthiotransferase accessory factor